jgi:UDP-N-acetylglucosamine transferase subunit ALG13
VIFVTVGHQMPFDRLIGAVDRWAAQHPAARLFAQIGAGGATPRHMESVERLSPEQFRGRMEEATAVVAHAGMGTIIMAVQMGRPLLVLPRLARLGETRNDHQVATARHFAGAGYLLAAADEDDLPRGMAELRDFRPRRMIAGAADPQLLARLRAFALGAHPRRAA